MQPQHRRLEPPCPLTAILQHENLRISQIFGPNISPAPMVEYNVRYNVTRS